MPIVRGIFHVVSCFLLHFMLYRGNLEYFLGQCRSSLAGQKYLLELSQYKTFSTVSPTVKGNSKFEKYFCSDVHRIFETFNSKIDSLR